MSPSTRIDFYFDTISPYSWLALEVLLRYRSIWNLEVHMWPVDLVYVIQGSKNAPPARVKARGKFLTNDLRRNARLFGVPFKGMPENFMAEVDPYRSLLAQRLLVAAVAKWGDTAEEVYALTREIYTTVLKTRAGLKTFLTPDILKECCKFAGFQDYVTDELLRAIQLDTTKQKLKDNTRAFLEKGGFGVPVMIIDAPELPKADRFIFGSDRFEQVAFMLGKPWLGPNPFGTPKL